MRKTLTLLSAVLVVGCTPKMLDPYEISAANYDDVDSLIGKRVKISGFISRRQGAYGVYFKQEDLFEENNRCIELSPFIDAPHGNRISITGNIEATGCGMDLICTNACSEYVIRIRSFHG